MLLFPGLLFSALVIFSQNSRAEEYCDWQLTESNGMPAIESRLCDLQGDPENGKQVAIDRSRGNCLACHMMPIPEEEFHGQVGPPLHCLAMRYSEGQLRARLVEPMLYNANTIMPGYYRHPRDNHRLANAYQGKTFLSAQELEDLVAFVVTLRCE